MLEFRTFVRQYPGGRQALAAALDVSEETVRTWETGDRTPRSKRLREIIKMSRGKLAFESFPGIARAA